MTLSPPPMILREQVPLAPYTTLGVGGPARFMIEAQTESQVTSALEFADAGQLEVFVLGGGSNILVSDEGFSGLVIRIALQGIEQKNRGQISAAAGEDWDQFVFRCVEQGFAGIECLSGIPGTVGGTPVQNVGAYGQEVSEVITSVRALDRITRQAVELGNMECGFGYRTSILNTLNRNRYVVLSVDFALRAGGQPRIGYPDLSRCFAGRTHQPSLTEVREAVLRIREGKSMVIRPGDPDAKSAGSFFKNPILPEERAAQIEEAARQHGSLAGDPTMPRYPMPDGMVKLSAAWLIERAGFTRGHCRGRAALSNKHALALINKGGATAQEIVVLMREIQAGVRQIFGVELLPEPVFVGFVP